MFKFKCQYTPQGHYFLSTLWLLSTDKYVVFFFYFEPWSTFKLFSSIMLQLLLTHLALSILVSLIKQWPIPRRTEAGQSGLVLRARL